MCPSIEDLTKVALDLAHFADLGPSMFIFIIDLFGWKIYKVILQMLSFRIFLGLPGNNSIFAIFKPFKKLKKFSVYKVLGHTRDTDFPEGC